MTVLLISRGIPCRKYPLNGIFEFDQAKALRDSGITVIIAALDMRSIRRWRKWGLKIFVRDGIEVFNFNLPIGIVPFSIMNVILSFGLSLILDKLRKKKKIIDIIHAHFLSNGYAMVKNIHKIRCPMILTEHSSLIMKDKQLETVASCIRFTYSHVYKVIAVSPALKHFIRDRYSFKSEYIPNLIDAGLFTISTLKREVPDSFTFVSVGNLNRGKGFDCLIGAFCKAFTDKLKIRLIIIGEGSERETIERIIEKNGMKDRIILKGIQTRDQISELFKESDCFVLASRYETFGVAYVEALFAGLPVIATSCGGPEHFINSTNGILVPVDDEHKLAEAMSRMVSESGKYSREGISIDARKQFTAEVVAWQIIKVYKEALHV